MGVEQTVRELFAAFSVRDVEAAVALCSEDCEFWPQGTAEVTGRTEPYRGHSGIRAYFDDVAVAWRILELEPQDLRFAGNGVIAFGHARGTTAAGDPLETAAIWVFKLSGDRISSMRAVPTIGAAQQAAEA